jgi:threonine dehydratase
MSNGKFQMSDVAEARRFLEKYLGPTRLVCAESLSDASGAHVSLKLEIENPTTTFKVRGALNAVHRRSQQSRLDGVVTSSTGNHGAAIAYAAREMNVRARIYLPENPNPVKRDRIAKMGAEIVEVGCDLEVSREHAERFSQESGWPLIVDVDDADIAAGAATIACEILEQAPATDVVIVPVGDSNLIRGIAFAVKQIRPVVRIIGVQAEAAPAYYLSWKHRRSESTETADTIADGLSTRTTTEDNVRQLVELVDDVRLVTEDEMLRAITFLLLNEHTVAEPAGAASTAALLNSGKEFTDKNVVLVVTGANIAPDVLRRAVESSR